jgi:predicted DNA-binding transcriptional regulator AlpA
MSALTKSVKPPPAVYDAEGVAARLRVSPRHVWRMRDAGSMPPPIRLGRLVRWRASAIDDWIAAGCPPIQKGAR